MILPSHVEEGENDFSMFFVATYVLRGSTRSM